MPSQQPEPAQGSVPYRASQRDPRFSYCLYRPQRSTSELVVLIHDGARDAMAWRDRFVDFAEATGAVLMAPLFPMGLPHVQDVDNFQCLHRGGTHFDQALLGMVDEVVGEYQLKERFCLFGFAAGGSFVQRFSLFHAGRLQAVSIASPDQITLPDHHQEWPVGTAGAAERLGLELARGALPRVAVHLVIGSEPTGDHHAATVTTMQGLSQAYWRNGIAARLDVVPGVCRSVEALIPASQLFLSRQLATQAADED